MSKYISISQIRRSMKRIEQFHIFFGTTFLVLKKNGAPIGDTMHLSLDAENREHLKKYYRIHPKSDHFFTPFQIKKNESRWRDPKYASTSLQAINTQGFSSALLHEKKEKIWGWNNNYLEFLSSKLPQGKKIPLLDFSVWFLKGEVFEAAATPSTVVSRFIRSFNISSEESSAIFDSDFDGEKFSKDFFSVNEPKWEEIIEGFGMPIDVPPDTGAILHFLEFSGLGPVRKMALYPGSRLNIVTGDNGLGKSFLLDVVWWSLTQEWADHMIVPIEPVATPPQIRFSVGNKPSSSPITAEFQPKSYKWKVPALSSKSGLVIYARVDGSFVVWDPAFSISEDSKEKFYSFTRDSVWNGDSQTEGLLRDWIRWQTRSSEFPAFETFKKVIQRLKPPDWDGFSIGKPQRVRGWKMEIPTLIHPYGTVPVVYESAGIRRILTLTYLIVWAWEEHKIQAKASGRKEERQMVILLDEAEAHLHPRWQRIILRALLGIAEDLHEELAIQYFIASHSPLVLASAESIWDPEKDKLFHLSMESGKVNFEETAFELRGSVNSWLKSPSFDELHPGSDSAEEALKKAKSLMTKEKINKQDVEDVSKLLAIHIAADDPFWMRWIVFAMQNGVEL